MKAEELKPGDRFFVLVDGARVPATGPLIFRRLRKDGFIVADQGPTRAGRKPDTWIVRSDREIVAA